MTLNTDNDKRRGEIVADLLSKPHPPGSRAFRRIEALTGDDGDYIPGRDEGETPREE